MKLVFIAAENAPPYAGPSPVGLIRLVGIPLSGDTPPPHLSEIADQAARDVRSTFPGWLWAQAQSALSLHRWPGPISWWWYTPLSEKSPLRSPLIRELYWLTLVKELLQRLPVDSVEWHGDDALIASAVQQIVQAKGIPFALHLSPRPWRRRPPAAWIRRILYSVTHGIRYAAIKLLRYGDVLSRTPPDTAFFTIYPSLWEFEGDRGTARMYGSWPQFLTQQGHSCFYPGSYEGPIRFLWTRRNSLIQRCRQNKILFIETQVPWLEWLSSHITPRFWFRYLSWRRTHRNHPVVYDNVDVTPLWWRELDANVLSSEIPFDLVLSKAFQNIATRWPSLQTLFHHFEYQPLERAIANGVRLAGDMPVIGLQAGIFTSNQMGFTFLQEEIQTGHGQDDRAPAPNFLAAYGELPYRVFSDRLSKQRVSACGPIRYPAFTAPDFDRSSFTKEQGLPANAAYLTVTTSISREESLTLLEAAFRLNARLPDTFLLIKFHYHLPLPDEARQLAQTYGTDRYQIFKKDLTSLLQTAPLMLCAGSSTAMEAIQLGSMPLVLRSIGEMSCNPMLDVPDSVFLWSTADELQQAVQSCFKKDALYLQKRARWPLAMAAQMSPLDGSVNTRLYAFLQAQRVYPLSARRATDEPPELAPQTTTQNNSAMRNAL